MKEKCFQLSYNALSDIQLKMSARNQIKKKKSLLRKRFEYNKKLEIFIQTISYDQTLLENNWYTNPDVGTSCAVLLSSVSATDGCNVSEVP